MKLFTTSTALWPLSARTRGSRPGSSARRSLDADGVLHGNLYLKGGGDPALGTPSFYNRFHGGLGTNLLRPRRQQYEARASSAVTGRLYADDTIFDRLRGVADSGYATSPYIGPLSGLAFNSGYSSPSCSGFAADPAKRRRRPWPSRLRKRRHRRAGPGGAGGCAAERQELAVVRSPQLGRIVNPTDVYSDNFFAEMLLKLLGAALRRRRHHRGGRQRGRSSSPAGMGSGVHAVDGSGLTRSNRASPLQVVDLLQSMRKHRRGRRLRRRPGARRRGGDRRRTHARHRRRRPLPRPRPAP